MSAASVCKKVGRHVWTYPGRKWPFDGQLCSCGTVAWRKEAIRRVG